MKILYFSGTKLPTHNARSIHCMKMAEAFALEGHDVILFAKGVAGVDNQEIFEAYDTQPCFELELIANISVPFFAKAVRWIDMSGRIKRHAKPDLIFGADILALTLLSPLNVDILLEAHELPENKQTNWAFSKLSRQPNFRGMIVTSAILKQDFLAQFPDLDPDKIIIAYDGAENINPVKKDTLNQILMKGHSTHYKIGYVGSLQHDKGIDLIAQIAERRPEYDFHLIGGTQRQVLKYRSQYPYSNLYFYGHRDHTEIPSYLDRFDLVLAPYQITNTSNIAKSNTRWVSPLKIFEYMAAQKPILCSDLPVTSEILQNEHNALLLPSDNASAWAEAIDFLKTNPKFAEEIAENANLDLKKKYTWKKRIQTILDYLYEQTDTAQTIPYLKPVSR